MALKSTIYKASLQLSDMDRHVYGEHNLTLALHPSETEQRLMVRLLAFALKLPADDERGTLQFARGLSDTDEPDLWQKDLTGQLVQWIEVGQPDERRLVRAASRSEHVSVIAFQTSTPIWFEGIAGRITRLTNLEILQLPTAQSQALATLCTRAMRLTVTVQDAHIWVADDRQHVELSLTPLWSGQR